jgi:predicted HicB family RNase H-like nuclease
VGRVNYLIPDDLHARAKALAAYKGQTLREWLIRAVEAAVDRQEAERDRRRGR